MFYTVSFFTKIFLQICFDSVKYLGDIGDDVRTLLRQLLVIGLVSTRQGSDLERLTSHHRHRDMTTEVRDSRPDPVLVIMVPTRPEDPRHLDTVTIENSLCLVSLLKSDDRVILNKRLEGGNIV